MVLYNALIEFAKMNPKEFAGLILVAHHIFDAAVDSMPAPKESDTRGYQFLYTFANKIAGNYRK